MGLHLRLQRLMNATDDEGKRRRIEAGGLRLVDSSVDGGGMGRQYLAMGLVYEPGVDPSTDVWPFVE